MAKKYVVTLTDEEREELHRLTSRGKAAARTLTHARILLLTDASEGGPGWVDERIREALGCGLSTVERVRQRFVLQGMEAALYRYPPNRQYERKLDGVGEAYLIAMSCSAPPDGHERWTLRLLADEMVERGHVDSLSHETVRQRLKKTNSSPGCRSAG